MFIKYDLSASFVRFCTKSYRDFIDSVTGIELGKVLTEVMADNPADSELLSEVIAVCNDLGHKTRNGDNKYILNKRDGNNVVRDLIRFLRNDDKHRFLVRKQLGLTNIVANDLIPIVEQHSLQDIPLFDKVLRLLVDLTNPSILLFRQKIPEDKIETHHYLELQSILYSYKLAFGAHKRFWTVLAKHLSRIVELDDDNRQVEDTLMFERILVLIRNVLHIPIDTNNDRTVANNEMNPHDRIIEQLSTSGIIDLIIFLSNDDSHQEFCFHMIEIISLIFREQNAEFIAKSVANNFGINDSQRSNYERDIDRQELKELKVRDISVRNQVPNNFSRFSGTYFVKNLKSISNRDVIFHKNPENFTQMDFDANKCIKKKIKKQKPMSDTNAQKSARGVPVIHRSTPKIRKILFDFCTDFLNNYNQFMSQIKGNLNRNMSQDNDETYYLWAIQFFMEFFRCNPKMNDSSLVSETMCGETFHFLQTQIEHYLEYLNQQKDEIPLWSKRLHYGLKAYRELLFSLNYFESCSDEGLRMRAKAIKKGIFYEDEYRELLLSLLRNYNETKMPKSFLKDLIETNHIFLKMLENYYNKNSRLVVKQKVRKLKKRKSQKKKQKTPPEEIWIEIMSTVSEALQGGIVLPNPDENSSIRAFDPASEKPIDEQKMDVLRRVHNFLEQKNVAEAVALYRDARNCWSGDDDNAFGAPDIPPEEEMISLNEVLMTNFPEEPDEVEDEVEKDEELVNEESHSRTREVEVHLPELISKYCVPPIVCNFALLLRNYATNSDQTNHCLIKMLHRIAFDSKMHAMLFQTSLFRTFQRILSDPMRNESPIIKELAHFAKFIVGKFVQVAQQNKKVFVELFFWKNCKEAMDIEEGYQKETSTSQSSKNKNFWTEEQELELDVLFKEFKDKNDGEKDYIDLILEKMIDESKTRRQLIKQLKNQVNISN